MFTYDEKQLEMDSTQSSIITKKIEIEQDVNFFIVIESENQKIIQPILNKIVDYLIDTLKVKDIYNTFWVTLESINFFINNLRKKEESLNNLNIIIWILEKNNFHFSKIGQASCYLINKSKEFIEISETSSTMKEFDYISSWKLSHNEKIILINKSLNNYLTQTDLEELWALENIEDINKNIVNILDDEKIKDNIKLVSINYSLWEDFVDKKVYIENTKNLFYKFFDNNFSKKSLALLMMLKEKIEKKWKLVKNIVFISWITISVFLLYSIIWWIVGNTIEGWKTNEYKDYLIEAREYLRLANENIANPESFNLNIEKSEELLTKVKEENLFLSDVNSIEDDISIIKKQFNWIETFETDTSNVVFAWNFDDWIKLLENNKKLYVIWKNSVYWPIVQWQDVKNTKFEELEVDDEFIDATISWDDIIIVTKKWRLVEYTKEDFNYINVLAQTTWEKSDFIKSYNWNIYLTDENSNQIYMHSPAQDWYNSWVWYLNEEDSKNIWEILAIWIDGWIYMLKKDLTLVKFFRSPKYRLESIILNNLPNNYNLENSRVNIVTKNNLTYIYILLNNKIWIFKPNTKVFTDTRSLKYIWQIEGKSEEIISFEVQRDNEIEVLTKSWIYKLWFEINEDKLIVR